MTGAPTGLESAETTLTNPAPCASGGVCGDTDDAGDVEAEWEASGVSGGEEGYVGMDGLGITGASLGTWTRDANEGIEVDVELTLLALWCVNGAGAGWGRTMSG
jgi:hypothetical protein